MSLELAIATAVDIEFQQRELRNKLDVAEHIARRFKLEQDEVFDNLVGTKYNNEWSTGTVYWTLDRSRDLRWTKHPPKRRRRVWEYARGSGFRALAEHLERQQ